MRLFPEPEPPLETPAVSGAPLAERMRPRTLEEFIGQRSLLAPGQPLRVQIESGEFGSLIFWGPPGVGKTTLARLLAAHARARFVPFSAVQSGIKEIREVMSAAEHAAQNGQRTLLFVDEIHRFNKAQQDAFLPYVERGAIRLIGATTENPSFELNSALLSRARVYVLEPLREAELIELLRRALRDSERGLARALPAGAVLVWGDPDQDPGQAEALLLGQIANLANGDARVACNLLESAALGAAPDDAGRIRITPGLLRLTLQRRVLLYDRAGEEHYNLISALHKSLRNSDPDAALYWLGRMLAAGEDPLYIARRMVRFASEDIGLADPNALAHTIAARDAFDFLGRPEGELALAQACVYLALAPKSNAVYVAYGEVQRDVETQPNLPVPLHIRNAPTTLMKDLGYGHGYQYAHDLPEPVADMQCLPDNLRNRHYFRPTSAGREARLAERLRELAEQRARAHSKQSGE